MTRLARIGTLGFVVILAFTAGCASKSDATGGSSSASAGASSGGGTDKYASVLDPAIGKLRLSDLPAQTVSLANGKVKFVQGENLKVAMIGYGKGFDYSVPEYQAADEQAKALGIEITSFDPAGDPEKELSQMQDIMNSGKYNAAVVYPLSTDLTCDLMTRQMPAAGIITVAIGNPACTDGNTPGVLTTVPDTGGTESVYQDWAHQIASKQKSGDKALMVAGTQLDYTTQLAVPAVKAAFQQAGIDLVDVAYTDFTQPDALQKAQDALTRHPDINLVVSSFPEGTQGALAAIKASGHAASVSLYDFGATKTILGEIQSGQIAGSSPFYPYTKTKTAFEALVLARHGQTVPSYIPYAGHAVESMRPAGTNSMFVTKDNVDAFLEKVAEY